MENKIKRFITCYVPVHACNFRCTYCYLSHHIDSNPYGGGIKKFVMPASEIAESLSPKRLGGLCYFNLCAPGETLLHPEIIDLVYELTKRGHYADIVTNGTLTNKFEELITRLDDNQKNRTFIKFSFHYLQLKEHNMMDVFVNNVNMIKKSGISYSIEITPHDELIPYIDEIKDFSMEHFGALPHITVARNERTKSIEILSKLSREEYKKVWGQFNSALFDFKLSVFNEKRNEFCYAGSWSLDINLEDGAYRQCYLGDILGNICNKNKKIRFCPIGKCRQPHCFNAHAFLAFGDIPELAAPTYLDERDRKTSKGDHWVTKEAQEFFSSKLYETNDQLSEKKKYFIYHSSFLMRCINHIMR